MFLLNFAIADIALAVSIGLPPPKPITASFLYFSKNLTPSKTTLSVGSGTVLSKTSDFKPALIRISCNFCWLWFSIIWRSIINNISNINIFSIYIYCVEHFI